MKKTITILLIIVMICIGLSGCKTEQPSVLSTLRMYTTFEESLTYASNVVIGKYIESEVLGNMYTRHKFSVNENIFGKATDEIYVYTLKMYVTLTEDEQNSGEGVSVYSEFLQGELNFIENSDYLLLLYESDYIYFYSSLKIPKYSLVEQIVIPMNNISQSSMYCDPINQHAKGIEFTDELDKETLINYISDIVKDNEIDYSEYEYIKSDNMGEIITNSPTVIKVKIEELDYTSKGDLFGIDVYWCTVTEILKNEESELKVGDRVNVTFFADTVKRNKEYIVAVKDIHSVEAKCYEFTSKNSLYTVKQHDDIMDIIEANND